MRRIVTPTSPTARRPFRWKNTPAARLLAGIAVVAAAHAPAAAGTHYVFVGSGNTQFVGDGVFSTGFLPSLPFFGTSAVNGDGLIFNAFYTSYTATDDLTASKPLSLNTLSFSSDGFRPLTLARGLTPGASNLLTLGTTAGGRAPSVVVDFGTQVTEGLDLALTADTTFNLNGSLAISGAISGTGGLLLANSYNSPLTLSGANTYSGGTTISGGTIVLTGAGTLGATTNSLFVERGSTLLLNGASQTLDALTGQDTLITTANANGPLTLTVGSKGGSGWFGGQIADHLFNGTPSTSTLGVTKVGAGTQTFFGSNNYSGATLVQGGTLSLAGGYASISNSNVTVAPGATLTFDNSPYGGGAVRAASVTLNNGTLNVIGSSSNPTTDTVTGNLTVGGTAFSTVNFQTNESNTQSTTLNLGGLTRTGTGLAYLQTGGNSGFGYGQNHVFLQNPPSGADLIGGGGPVYSPTASIIPWLRITNFGFTGFAAYDPSIGLYTVGVAQGIADGTISKNNVYVNGDTPIYGGATVNSLNIETGNPDSGISGFGTLRVTSGAINSTYGGAIGRPGDHGTLDFGTAQGVVTVANGTPSNGQLGQPLAINDSIAGAGGLVIGLNSAPADPSSQFVPPPATLILAGSNTYTGGTTIYSNSLSNIVQIGNPQYSDGYQAMAGQFGDGDIINNGATIEFARSDSPYQPINGAQGLTVANNISGSGALLQAGYGLTTLAGNNTFTGAVTVSGGWLRQGSATALGASGDLTVGVTDQFGNIQPAVFQLGGFDATVHFLSGNGVIENASVLVNPTGQYPYPPATLTVALAPGAHDTFGGQLQDGFGDAYPFGSGDYQSFALAVTGGGTLTLNDDSPRGQSVYFGGTTVTGAAGAGPASVLQTNVTGGTKGPSTPFGYGTVTLDNAALGIGTGEAAAGQTLNILAGTLQITGQDTLALNKGAGAGLTFSTAGLSTAFTDGTYAPFGYSNGGYHGYYPSNPYASKPTGVLLVTPSGPATLGTPGGEQVFVSSSLPVFNGMIAPNVVDTTTRQFLTNGPNGLADAAPTQTFIGGTLAGASSSDIVSTAGNVDVRGVYGESSVDMWALRTSGTLGAPGAAETVSVGSGGVILTDGATINADLRFGSYDPVFLGGFNFATGVVGAFNGTNTLAGSLSGTGGLLTYGTGTLALAATSSQLSGGVVVAGGTLRPTVANALGTGNALTVERAGTLDLGADQHFASLAGNGLVTSSGGATLTLDDGNRGYAYPYGLKTTFSGVLGGSVNLVKNDSDTQVLNGLNLSTGTTTVNGGILLVTADGALGADGTIVNGAYNFNTGNFGGTLQLQAGKDYQSPAPLTLTGDGLYSYFGGPLGALTTTGIGVTTFAGPITIDPSGKYGSTTISAGGGTLNLTGGVVSNSANGLVNFTDGTVTIGTPGGSDGLALGTDNHMGVRVAGSYGINGLIPGTLVLNAPSGAGADGFANFTADTGGTLRFGASDVLTTDQFGSPRNALYVSPGGTIDLQSFHQTANVLSLGGGTLTGSGGSLTSYLDVYNGSGTGVSVSTVGGGATVIGNGYQGQNTALVLDGVLDGSHTLDSAAALRGTGSVTGTVTLASGDTVSGGDDAAHPGTLTLGGLIVNGVGDTIGAGVVRDDTTVNGGLTVAAGATLATDSLTVNSGGMVTVSGSLTGRTAPAPAVTLNGGTLADGGVPALSLGTLTLGTGKSILDFGAGNTGALLLFADSSLQTWSGTLNVWDWNGSADTLFFTGPGGGLTGTQVQQIAFFSGQGGGYLGQGMFSPNGVVPAPEPSAVASLLLGTLGLGSLRLRARRCRAA